MFARRGSTDSSILATGPTIATVACGYAAASASISSQVDALVDHADVAEHRAAAQRREVGVRLRAARALEVLDVDAARITARVARALLDAAKQRASAAEHDVRPVEHLPFAR